MLSNTAVASQYQPAANAKSLDVLLAQYLEVSSCWNDHGRAVRTKMSVEKAIAHLREVRDSAKLHRGGKRLSEKAHKLMWDIVDLQADGNID